MAEYDKQLPLITASNRPFWAAAKRHELVVYKCLNCGSAYLQDSDCTTCGGPRMAWVRASGRGRVFTFCVFHQAFHPAWKGDIPYNVAYVKLDEGPLLVSNIVGCERGDISIGMPVEVVFEDITAEVTLPKFRPVK
ncbi:MAG: hypothetical protein A2Z29_03915 [Chloroflexi bacterium RBG_16_56_11]|nr:MAG: hypothetical protein A2Z29_03915 [Chloroflexi bacterium RBG_16_56_11]